MDEQEKKYQDLFTELTNYERSGVRMQMKGMIRELDFNSIGTDHSQVE